MRLKTPPGTPAISISKSLCALASYPSDSKGSVLHSGRNQRNGCMESDVFPLILCLACPGKVEKCFREVACFQLLLNAARLALG